MLLIVTLGRLGAAITGDNAPRAVEDSRFYTRSMRFADAYRKGLNGRQAAWAAKRYRSHRTIPPEAILDAPTE